jgi:amidase
MRKLLAACVAASVIVACQPAAAPPAAAKDPYDFSALATEPKTIADVQAEIAGKTSSVEAITRRYLERIAAVDDAGPKLNAVLAVNPNALANAQALDGLIAGAATGQRRLLGVPILLKDNIETIDPMATTAGSLALKDNLTGRDSPLAARLREAGAVILGKTNLSEWANFRSNASSSGWSAVGGQTKNPHVLDRNPCAPTGLWGSSRLWGWRRARILFQLVRARIRRGRWRSPWRMRR